MTHFDAAAQEGYMEVGKGQPENESAAVRL